MISVLHNDALKSDFGCNGDNGIYSSFEHQMVYIDLVGNNERSGIRNIAGYFIHLYMTTDEWVILSGVILKD